MKASARALVLLIILPAIMLIMPAYSALSDWSLTVQTDKPYYHVLDKVYINGTLTYKGGLEYNLHYIKIEVKNSSGYDYTLPTVSLINGSYSANLTLGTYTGLGQYTLAASTTVQISPTTSTTITNQTTFLVTDTIYIKTGGNVEPANAPISRNGNFYSMTGNISANSTDGIVIERTNTILDGAGFTLTGNSLVGSNGINLTSVSNVTIRNISIKLFHNGIYGYSFSNGQIAGSNLLSDDNGIYFMYSNLNTIEGNNITGNAYAGIWLDQSQSNNISDNRLAFNTIATNHVGGINLQDFSSYNNIVDNSFVNNTWYGVYIQNSNVNNIFHNNFINNTHYQAFVEHVISTSYGNVWDDGYPSGGNYWNNYTGIDLKSGPNQNQPGSDGIGDTSYVIDANNMDHYPLVNAWVPPETTETTITATNLTEYAVMITATNATVQINPISPNKLNFTLTGTPGTKGSLLIIVPWGLNSTNLKVYVNGLELTSPPPTISTNGTHYFIYCQLSFSTLQIVIPFVVPVIPLGTLTATLSMIAVLGAYVKQRRRKTPI